MKQKMPEGISAFLKWKEFTDERWGEKGSTTGGNERVPPPLIERGHRRRERWANEKGKGEGGGPDESIEESRGTKSEMGKRTPHQRFVR